MGSKESGNRTSAARHGPEEIGNKDDKVIMKGPWSEEEDSILVDYIQNHGEGHWDFVARCTGLRRTGKSCRLRWLNYLRPGIRHGKFTLEEQLKILELHFLWGNRWSKIAESLNGRTDNEVKNYWRTRVHRQAKLLNCDVNGKEFGDIIRFVLMPRLAEQIRSKSRESSQAAVLVSPAISSSSSSLNINLVNMDSNDKALIMMRDHTNSLQDQWPLIQHDHRNEDGGDDQVGDEIWNDENVEFLRQQLFGHDDSDV